MYHMLVVTLTAPTAIELSALSGIILSLLFSYTPKFKDWFAGQDSVTKSLIMVVLLLLTAAGSLFYKCNLGVECISANWEGFFMAFVTAAIANQTTYALSPQTKSVKAIKAARPQ